MADGPLRCPECGFACSRREDLDAHFAANFLCGMRARELLSLASMGYRECPRCGMALVGALRETDDGWAHARCARDNEQGDET